MENFWWHTQCTQLCSRCTLQSHVWLPFVVFTDGEHQHPSHPTLLTSGLPDPSVCLLINQSEDHAIYSWLIHNKGVVKAQKEYLSPLKTDLSKSISHKDVFKWHLLPISAIKCSILQNNHVSVYSRCAVYIPSAFYSSRKYSDIFCHTSTYINYDHIYICCSGFLCPWMSYTVCLCYSHSQNVEQPSLLQLCAVNLYCSNLSNGCFEFKDRVYDNSASDVFGLNGVKWQCILFVNMRWLTVIWQESN